MRRIGPIPPRTAVKITTNFLVPSPRLLNFSNISPTNLTTGVSAFKNSSPTGAMLTFRFSIAFLNL